MKYSTVELKFKIRQMIQTQGWNQILIMCLYLEVWWDVGTYARFFSRIRGLFKYLVIKYSKLGCLAILYLLNLSSD